jgi:hypothetical protein
MCLGSIDFRNHNRHNFISGVLLVFAARTVVLLDVVESIMLLRIMFKMEMYIFSSSI